MNLTVILRTDEKRIRTLPNLYTGMIGKFVDCNMLQVCGPRQQGNSVFGLNPVRLVHRNLVQQQKTKNIRLKENTNNEINLWNYFPSKFFNSVKAWWNYGGPEGPSLHKFFIALHKFWLVWKNIMWLCTHNYLACIHNYLACIHKYLACIHN